MQHVFNVHRCRQDVLIIRISQTAIDLTIDHDNNYAMIGLQNGGKRSRTQMMNVCLAVIHLLI